MNVAVIDIGSNSSRLNVFELEADGSYEVVGFKRELTALVGYVDASNALSADGIAVACDSLITLKENAICEHDVDQWLVFATASLREISNSQCALAAIKDATGFEVDILTGEQEAACGFESLRRRFDVRDAVLADVGGGSTELVVIRNGEVASLTSLPLGCRKLSDNYMNPAQSASEQHDGMRAYVREVLARDNTQCAPGSVFFGIGGTAKALHRMIGNNKPELPCDLMERARAVCPERLDTIAAGAIIFDELWKKFQPASFMSSNANAREGYFVKFALPELEGHIR